MPSQPPAVVATEVRVLEGPNLYFTRPAVKVSLSLPGYAALSKLDAAELGVRVGLRSARPGQPGTALRQRHVMRVVRLVVRALGRQLGVRKLNVRVRPGEASDAVVVAFPWANRRRAVAMGESLAVVLAGLLDPEEGFAEVLAQVGGQLARLPDGPAPTTITPRVPVASITGTNGKTTTTRLLAHICMTAGLRTAWSSTDGIVVMGETVEAGDYSGPAGARGVLETPGLQVGILETARGGMLLKGMGVTRNDVSVVTNVSADHLGVNGIDTLDQLAEVKAIVTTVTKAQGWAVLNGDDPRVWAMRQGTPAHPWVFTLDPAAPAIWESLNAGGRAITVVDDMIVVLRPNGDPDRLVRLADVPMTMFGLSTINIANALAGTAAALGLGIEREAVVEGLRTFAPDPTHNSGRLNCYSVPVAGGVVTIVVDMAHNEAGLEALLQVGRGLVAPGGAVRLALGTGGDRTDDMLRGMGRLAAGVDDGVIKHTPHYLRGRTPENLVRLLQEGLAQGGVHVAGEVADDELSALALLVGRARPGDVVAIMCHEQRRELERWIASRGGTPDSPKTLRRKVVGARGEHELQPEIDALSDLSVGSQQVDAAHLLLEAHPGDARLEYELALALQASGEAAKAREHFASAIAAGLGEPYRHRALVGAAVASLAIDDVPAAEALVGAALDERPGLPAAMVVRAHLRARAGQSEQAYRDLVAVLSGSPPDAEVASALHQIHHERA